MSSVFYLKFLKTIPFATKISQCFFQGRKHCPGCFLIIMKDNDRARFGIFLCYLKTSVGINLRMEIIRNYIPENNPEFFQLEIDAMKEILRKKVKENLRAESSITVRSNALSSWMKTSNRKASPPPMKTVC